MPIARQPLSQPPTIAGERREKLRGWAKEAAAVIVGALILLGVVVIDGRPVVFADTNIYVWMGDMQMRPVRYLLSPIIGGPSSAKDDPDAADEDPADMSLRHTEMAARSAWFGLVLYAVTSVGTLWAYAALQGLAASYAVRKLWRGVVTEAGTGGGALEHLAVMALLAAGTTLPFFVGFAMPDLWAGVGLVALASLLFAPQTLSRAAKAALFLLVLAAMTFHRSNAMAALPALALAALAARLSWGVAWRRMAPGLWRVAVALGVAVSLQAGYGLAVKLSSGDTLRSPPFLAARILADGPGRTYLRRSCAEGTRWALCRFRALPLDDSQDILWSGDPRKGVFGRAGTAERIRIDRQQLAFVASAVAADPAGAAGAAASDFWRTLITVNLEDPLRNPHFYLTDPDWRDTYIADLVHDMGPCDPDERGCKPRFDARPLGYWHGGVCLAALAGLAVIIAWRRTRERAFSEAVGPIVILLLCALVFNAAATGILSGPFARYQARIAWLPLLAALLAARGLLRRPPAAPAPTAIPTSP